MTSQQLKEELQEAGGVDQIFVPQKNQRFAEGLIPTGDTKNFISNPRVACQLHKKSAITSCNRLIA